MEPGENKNGDSDYSDALAQQVKNFAVGLKSGCLDFCLRLLYFEVLCCQTQVKRMAMEVRQMQLANARQITVLNGGYGQMGKH